MELRNKEVIMQARRKPLAIGIGVALEAVFGAGAGLAVAEIGGDDGDEGRTGETYRKAVAPALAYPGGEPVKEAGVGDGGAAFDVGVRLDDGRQREVMLDDGFNVNGEEVDG